MITTVANKNLPMSEKPFNPMSVVRLSGAFMAYLIGSGFATGQEGIQFFVSFGINGLIGCMISFILLTYVCNILYKVGFKHGFKRNEDVFVHYCGNYVGKFLTWYTMIFIVAVYAIMLSGTGATIEQHYGLPSYIGTVLMALLSGGTLLMGLRKIVNIIAIIGPIIVAFTILISILTLVETPVTIVEGAAKVAEMDILAASNNWLMSALLYAGLMIPGLASFLPALGASAKCENDLKYSSILGPLLFVGALFLLVLALMVKVDVVNSSQIPVMALANDVLPVYASIFAIIIFCGIYTTATPLLWTVCSRFAEDKTPKYNTLVVSLVLLGLIGATLLPFAQLVNWIYPTVGYAGLVFLACAIFKNMRSYKANK
ncbi:hypothetical protein RGQ13_08345 [Thalassotalea psychrophila]|uniref:Uncharacterized protein n=1 Tax=Thalassotalea psychrophila TaxID=3065647 RepID=A0ABY9TYT5_9GAMM|nr:hypothetical protein RGQ13_08345 [Colwelliaceae bacterium SQ149]